MWPIMHFTHVDNLPRIVAEGALVSDCEARSGLTASDIGDQAIKEARRGKRLPEPLAGTVGEYVPFYYAPRSPMLYRIWRDCADGRFGRRPHDARAVVYLTSTVSAVLATGATWVASDGNAATAVTRFTDRLEDMEGLIDWPLMRETYWRNTEEDPDRMRRRKAEFLVHGHCSLAAIDGVVAYSREYAHMAGRALADHPLAARVTVSPGWYY